LARAQVSAAQCRQPADFQSNGPQTPLPRTRPFAFHVRHLGVKSARPRRNDHTARRCTSQTQSVRTRTARSPSMWSNASRASSPAAQSRQGPGVRRPQIVVAANLAGTESATVTLLSKSLARDQCPSDERPKNSFTPGGTGDSLQDCHTCGIVVPPTEHGTARDWVSAIPAVSNPI